MNLGDALARREQLRTAFDAALRGLINEFLQEMAALEHSGYPIVELHHVEGGGSRDFDPPEVRYYVPKRDGERGWSLYSPRGHLYRDALVNTSLVITSLHRLAEYDQTAAQGNLKHFWRGGEWQLSDPKGDCYLGPVRDASDLILYDRWFTLVEEADRAEVITRPLTFRMMDAIELYRSGHYPAAPW
jgi:hypothetical protein